MKSILKLFTALLISTVASAPIYAQYSATSYFMSGSMQGNMLNSAFAPDRGYILLPVIGSTNIDLGSNALTFDKIFYPNPNGEGIVSFLDTDIEKGPILDRLKDKNNIDWDVTTNLLGFGFYTKNIFWSFGSNIRVSGDLVVPKELFSMAALNKPDNNYNIAGLGTYASAYIENYIGTSVKVNDKIRVGGKIKVLLGYADAKIKYDNLNVALSGEEWNITAHGRADISIDGLEVDSRIGEMVNFNDIGGTPGLSFSGYGAAIDLGVTYDVIEDLRVSLSVTDIGFIKWSDKNTISIEGSNEFSYAGTLFGEDGFGTTQDFNVDELLNFERKQSESRTNVLRTNIYAAAEYSFLNDIFSAGLLYSANMRSDICRHDITTAISIHPTKWFTTNATYSFITGQMGAALNIHPCWINLFLGVDYMPLKVTPQYIPIESKRFNFYCGLAIPITKKSNL